MKITKYLHSCVALEDSGKRLLFDPGAFVFIEGKMQPEDIGPVDVVLITHTHPDHYFPEALKKLYALKPFTLLVSEDTVKTMEADGLGVSTQTIVPGDTVDVGGFTVRTFNVPHEKIPMACPHDMGYKINDTVYHPGDSYMVPADLGAVKVLMLPNGGPWATTVQTVQFAESIQPEMVIPIHDAMHKDFWLERISASVEGWMKERGIGCKVLGMGESVEHNS